MKKTMIVAVIAIVVAAVAAVMQYNRIVALDEEVKAQWAQVESQLQRRADLVPNLVNTVKGYATHESSVFTAVTEARSKVGQASTFEGKVAANTELTGALSRLLVVAENYPDLKANANFINLQTQLEGTENRIAQERRRYNETVMRYNKSIRRFPGMIAARLFGFGLRMPFESQPGVKQVPEVKF